MTTLSAYLFALSRDGNPQAANELSTPDWRNGDTSGCLYPWKKNPWALLVYGDQLVLNLLTAKRLCGPAKTEPWLLN